MGVKPHLLTRNHRTPRSSSVVLIKIERKIMALVMDIAQFTVKELGLSKVEPATRTEWTLINSVMREKVGE